MNAAGREAGLKREMTLERLRNMSWIRDLVSDIAPPAERLIPRDGA